QLPGGRGAVVLEQAEEDRGRAVIALLLVVEQERDPDLVELALALREGCFQLERRSAAQELELELAVLRRGTDALEHHGRMSDLFTVDCADQVAEHDPGLAPRALARQADDHGAASRAEPRRPGLDLGRRAQHDADARFLADALRGLALG